MVITVILILACLLFGFFLFSKPGLAIELQRRFYEKINWKIEPVSMAKELRNTRIMGLAMVIITIAIAAFKYYLK